MPRPGFGERKQRAGQETASSRAGIGDPWAHTRLEGHCEPHEIQLQRDARLTPPPISTETQGPRDSRLPKALLSSNITAVKANVETLSRA